MLNSIVYRLAFRSPVRIGERGVGLEATRPYVPADTLFSAICIMWRELYDVNDLKEAVLKPSGSDGEPVQQMPLIISSAFPYAGAVNFYPKPIARIKHLKIADLDTKAFKRVQFVSEAIFEKMIGGEPLTFDKSSCGNHGKIWFERKPSVDGHPVGEEKELKPFWQAPNEYEFWSTQVRPRVALDRVNSASQIWHIGSVHFHHGCGLWFAADFNSKLGPDFRQKFESCLRLLGDTGIGGERGGGYGLFEFTSSVQALPSASNAKAFLTLAPLCPRNADELNRLVGGGDPFYEIITRRGWIASREGSTLRRKTVWMFSEGSVFSGSDSTRAGALTRVTPKIWEEDANDALEKHSVYRYGYAFPVGFKQEA